MQVLNDVGPVTLVLGVAAFAAVAAGRLAALVSVPTAAIFLAAGVALGAVSDQARDALSIDEVARLGTFALIFVLFHGGFEGGWARARRAVGPILGMGLLGTFATTAALAVCGHLLGISWDMSILVAVALAPTDPAAVFSVLGGQHIEGRTDIVIEGESGANDPVGIALMIGAIAYVDGSGSLGTVAWEFALELGVGVLVGVVIGMLLGKVAARVRPTDRPSYAIACGASALLVFGIADVLHGSGFLAVFIAGLVLGNVDVPAKESTADMLAVAAGLGETAMFTALGLTVSLAALHAELWTALALFVVLTFLIRPVVTWLVLAPASFTHAEKAFVSWGGLKGAVPILLASFTLLAHVDDARSIYATVFVAVAASILLQGMTMPLTARRLGLETTAAPSE
jgi:cell volume regulation protein A